MKSFEIGGVKEFMNELLCRETFDEFLMAEASIVSTTSMILDGHVTEDYLTEEELATIGLMKNSCVPYSRMRPICFSFIKGKFTPRSFRIVLLANHEMIKKLLTMGDLGIQAADIGNLSLTVRFYEGHLTLVTGCALKTFTMDKSLENAWDDHIRIFLNDRNLL